MTSYDAGKALATARKLNCIKQDVNDHTSEIERQTRYIEELLETGLDEEKQKMLNLHLRNIRDTAAFLRGSADAQ
jgi:hypothetical protein